MSAKISISFELDENPETLALVAKLLAGLEGFPMLAGPVLIIYYIKYYIEKKQDFDYHSI